MTRFSALLFGAVLLAVPLLLTACDDGLSASANDSSAASSLEAALKSELDLTDAQAASLYGLPDDVCAPGTGWRLAGALHTTLTDEQRARLLARADQPAPRGRRGGPGGAGPGLRGNMPRGGPQGARSACDDRTPLLDLLSDEQRAQARALRIAFRTEVAALRDDLRAGTLDRDAFRDEVHALRAQLREDLQALLTDEQRAQLEAQREARRSEAKAARNDVLKLSTATADALDALQAEHRDAARALFDDARAGNLDRSAVRDAVRALRAEHEAALEDLLTDEQFAIVQLHRALMRWARAPRGGGPPGGPMGGGIGSGPMGNGMGMSPMQGPGGLFGG